MLLSRRARRTVLLVASVSVYLTASKFMLNSNLKDTDLFPTSSTSSSLLYFHSGSSSFHPLLSSIYDSSPTSLLSSFLKPSSKYYALSLNGEEANIEKKRKIPVREMITKTRIPNNYSYAGKESKENMNRNKHAPHKRKIRSIEHNMHDPTMRKEHKHTEQNTRKMKNGRQSKLTITERNIKEEKHTKNIKQSHEVNGERNGSDLGDRQEDDNTPPSAYIEVEATLSAFGVTVKVEGKQVYELMNMTLLWGSSQVRLHAGVHLITLDQHTGRVLRATTYQTWQPENYRQLVTALTDAGQGRLLLLLATPEFTVHLGSEVVDYLTRLGSQFSGVLSRDEVWCVVAWQGGRVVHETLTTSHHYYDDGRGEAPPTAISLLVPRRRELWCEWYSDPDLHHQAQFCLQYSGYGDLCRCEQPPWSPRPPQPSPPGEEVIPVALVTGGRLPRVLRQVHQLRSSTRGPQTPITFFVDGDNTEAAALGRLLNITIIFNTNNPATRGTSARINEHIKFSLNGVFQHYTDANFAIILEDDLELAPDFMSYFHQTAPLLRSDPFLMFVNAYNYNAYPHTAHDPARLYRAHGIPGYGWMTSRNGAREMLEGWAPLNQTGASWDWWVRARVLGSRDMIIPEVPRTRHMGGGGTHISGFDQVLFTSQPLNQDPHVILDVDSVQEGEYEAKLLDDLRTAELVVTQDHPCYTLPIPTHQTNKTYLLYIYQPDENHDHYAYEIMATCLGINTRDIHENLRMMVTFPFFGNQVYLVACPHSPYCKPGRRKVVFTGTEEDLMYAKQTAFLRPALTISYALRTRPKNPSQAFNLENRSLFSYTVGGKNEGRGGLINS